MRAALIFSAVTMVVVGCGHSRVSESARVTNVPASAARGGGPTVVYGPDVPAGTRFRARVDTPVSTTDAVPGQPFYATLVQPITGPGDRVIAPAGTQVVGRVYSARNSRRLFGVAHLAVGVEGLNVAGTYVPMTARVASADVVARRSNPLAPIRSAIPSGSMMTIELERPLPVAALDRAATHSARGGGPQR